jgi:hypothetical protein
VRTGLGTSFSLVPSHTQTDPDKQTVNGLFQVLFQVPFQLRAALFNLSVDFELTLSKLPFNNP